jgi:hypothetical protein
VSEPFARWWAGKLRQTWRHFRGRVTASERAQLASWLTPGQLDLFDRMHRADQRHGLDVVASLRAAGHTDLELLLAGLIHDSGKGPSVKLWHRVAWSLGERYGQRLHRVAERLPGFREPLERIRVHADRSAELALAAGCSPVTAALIRHQAGPVDGPHGDALLLADEQN